MPCRYIESASLVRSIEVVGFMVLVLQAFPLLLGAADVLLLTDAFAARWAAWKEGKRAVQWIHIGRKRGGTKGDEKTPAANRHIGHRLSHMYKLTHELCRTFKHSESRARMYTNGIHALRRRIEALLRSHPAFDSSKTFSAGMDPKREREQNDILEKIDSLLGVLFTSVDALHAAVPPCLTWKHLVDTEAAAAEVSKLIRLRGGAKTMRGPKRSFIKRQQSKVRIKRLQHTNSTMDTEESKVYLQTASIDKLWVNPLAARLRDELAPAPPTMYQTQVVYLAAAALLNAHNPEADGGVIEIYSPGLVTRESHIEKLHAQQSGGGGGGGNGSGSGNGSGRESESKEGVTVRSPLAFPGAAEPGAGVVSLEKLAPGVELVSLEPSAHAGREWGSEGDTGAINLCFGMDDDTSGVDTSSIADPSVMASSKNDSSVIAGKQGRETVIGGDEEKEKEALYERMRRNEAPVYR